ncbi:MAG TPA: SurA N-terminal domain-containing protein [Candidatus Paceibacterota bacterium]|nr:SurA N-terminal domain-containing protein [Candidatus Paceibacterota bacterium]
MDQETAHSSEHRRRGSSTKMILIIVAIVIIVVGGAFFAFKKGMLSLGEQKGKTVATVNGEPIYQHDVDLRLNQLKPTYAAQGVNLDDQATLTTVEKQIVDEIVNEDLILQDAKTKNISVTDAEVKDAMDQLVASAGSQDALDTQIKQFGMSSADLQDTLQRNLILQKYVDQLSAAQNITVSEKEISDAYDQMTQGQAASTTPALKDVHDQVEEQVKNQKIAAQVLAVVNQLKQTAKINILI